MTYSISGYFFFGSEEHKSLDLPKLILCKEIFIDICASSISEEVALKSVTSGSSNFFEGGIIAYSEKAKINQLQVKNQDIAKYSAVSEQVAQQMVVGVKSQFQSDYALATTGYAGPTGDKVGQVFIAFAAKEEIYVSSYLFEGERKEIVCQAAVKGLSILLSKIKK